LLNITDHKTNLRLRSVLFFLFFLIQASNIQAQLTVSGTVYDSSKVNYVENARVVSTAGLFTVTDSMGRYSISTSERDSLTFYYNGKPTQKFSVGTIPDPSHFDISLRIKIKGKYSMLKEVTVFSKSYRQDSLENRQQYADIYDYTKPGLKTSISPTGGVGADVDELINIFRFKRNKRLRAFQHRLETEEQEKYVDFRFNKLTVRRITGLQAELLDTFLVWYRPSYEFTRNSDEIMFNQYVLSAFYQFKTIMPVQPAKKEEQSNDQLKINN
jgi:hypothetical protein